MRRDWTTGEVRTLKKLWPQTPRAEVLAALPRHTEIAIRVKASQLKIRRKGVPRTYLVNFVRMERQTGAVEIQASTYSRARREAAARVRAMQSRDYSKGPTSWEQDVHGHKIKIDTVALIRDGEDA